MGRQDHRLGSSTFGARARTVGTALLLFFATACASGPTVNSSAFAAARQDVPRLMQEALVPGLQMAVIQHGRIEVLSFGTRDARSGEPVTADTVFEAASLGKPVLAYAVLRLASAGRLELDAPIGEYLKGLSPPMTRVTARQLMSHSAGLAAGAPTVEPSDPPRFSYSGEGFKLLQKLVEHVSREPLQQFMQKAVFEPLGMTSSSFVWREDYADRKAFGHSFTGSSAGRSRIAQAQAASSLETTAGDYSRFLLAAAEGTGLLPGYARQFLQPQVPLEVGCVECVGRPRGAAATGLHWGLGFGLEEAGGRTYAWHWGDNQTMQSYAAIDTSGRSGVVILTNSANGHSIARQVASSVLGSDAPGYAWVASYGPHTEPSRHLLSKIVRDGTAGLSSADLALPAADMRRVAERLVDGGHAPAAALLMRRAIAAGNATADDYAIMAHALRKAGTIAEAKTAAHAALRREPENKRARQVLESITRAERLIPATRLASFAGRYSSPYGPLEVRSDGRRLTAHLLDQPPSEMLPLSDSSFLMEAMGVPIKFVTGPDGIITHAIVSAGGEITLPRLPGE